MRFNTDHLGLNTSRQRYYQAIRKWGENNSTTGRIRDLKYLRSLLDKGRFTGGTGEINETFSDFFINQLEGIIEILDLIYGDNWDFILRPETTAVSGGRISAKFSLWCLIHFPEFEISNSNGNTKIQNDVVIAFNLKMNHHVQGDKIIRIDKVLLNKYTYTPEDFIGRYTHSHSPSRILNSYVSGAEFHEICEGDETDLGFFLSSMRVGDISGLTKESFASFLLLIQSFIEWESLEGGPYINMGEARYRYASAIGSNRHRVSINFSDRSVERGSKEFIKNVSEEDIKKLKFHKVRGKTSVATDKTFTTIVIENLLKGDPSQFRGLIHSKYGEDDPNKWQPASLPGDVVGSNVSQAQIDELRNIDGELPRIFIRDKLIEFKIDQEEVEEEEEFSLSGLGIVKPLEIEIKNKINEIIKNEEFRIAFHCEE